MRLGSLPNAYSPRNPHRKDKKAMAKSYMITRACRHGERLWTSRTGNAFSLWWRLLNNTDCHRCRTQKQEGRAGRTAEESHLPVLDGEDASQANVYRVRQYSSMKLTIAQLVSRGHSEEPLIEAFNRTMSTTSAEFWIENKSTTALTLLKQFLQEEPTNGD